MSNFSSKRLSSSLLVAMLCLSGRVFGQAPTLQAHLPVSNSRTATATTKIQLIFSQPMSAQTATPAVIRVVSNWRGQLAGIFTGAGSTNILFTPMQSLLPGESLSVTVTTQASSLAGDALARAVNYQFAVAESANTGAFPNTPDLAVAYRVRDVAVVDVDKDGHLDMLTACNSTTNAGSINVRLGDGRGGFRRSTDVALVGSPTSLTVGDVNQDGNLDFVTANRGASTVSVGLGDGTGGFVTMPEVAVGQGPFQVVLRDVNQDSQLDVLTVSAATNAVSLRVGDGKGGFQVPTLPMPVPIPAEIAVGSAPIGLAVADVNQDGKSDLVTVGGATVTVRLGDGKGNFTGTATTALNYRPAAMSLQDVNEDGLPDLLLPHSNVSAVTGRGAVSVRLGDGTGKFTGAVEASVDRDPARIVIGDVNNDGHLDFITGNQLNDVVAKTASVRLGDGKGNFGGFVDYTVGGTPGDVPTLVLALADLTEDKQADLIAVSNRFTNPASPSSTMNVSVRAGDGGGHFSGYREVEFGQVPPNSTGQAYDFGEATVADINNDHALDLLVTTPYSGGIGVKLNNGRGDFILMPAVALPANASPYSLAAGDINNDGKLDFVTANFGQTGVYGIEAGGQAISVRLGDGQGAFTAGTDIALTVFPYHVYLKDINSDGNLDLIYTTYTTSANAIVVKLGDGKGGFVDKAKLTQGVGRGVELSVVDLNSDGVLDLVATDQGSATFYTCLGDGTGAFTMMPAVYRNGSPFAPVVADVNNDTNLDLLFLSTGNAITVYLGDGKGGLSRFGNTSLAAYLVDSNSLTITDVNGDGFADAIVGSLSLGMVVFTGDGKGNFIYDFILSVKPYISNVVACDINNDGTTDLLAACQVGGSVSVRLNSSQSAVLSTAQANATTATAKLVVYPNPGWGSVHLFNAPANQIVELVDVTGQRVRDYPSAENALDVAGLAPGLYLLRCGTQTVRLQLD